MSIDITTEIQNINETNTPEEKFEVVFSNEDEINHIISRSIRGDLYTIGKLWIYALRAFLTGVHFWPITTVYAAPQKKEFPKELPPSELPLYGCDHLKCKKQSGCPGANEKLIHNAIKPTVVAAKNSIESAITHGKKELIETYDEITTDLGNAGQKVKKYCRCDKNLTIRQGIVATGGLLGYYLGSKGGIPRKVFSTACGLAATGMLCFPKETDEKIRDVSYYAGKGLVKVINYIGGRNLELRENLICPQARPPEQKFVKKCEEKKK